jgi:hypothetical protein
MSMSPRHAAALALVGWYLMVPPIAPPDPGTDLKYWSNEGSFDTAAECRAASDELVYKFGHMSNKDWKSWDDGYFAHYHTHLDRAWTLDHFKGLAVASQCIATDDPRLKEK